MIALDHLETTRPPAADLPVPAACDVALFLLSGGTTGVPKGVLNIITKDAEDIEAWERAGVDRLIVTPWKRSPEAIEAMRAFAERFLT